jgi:chemotaxis protein MotB
MVFSATLASTRRTATMTIYPSKFTGYLLCVILGFSGLPIAWADDLAKVRYGESARTFAAGSIQQSTPQDGAVNVVTGDNQTMGNRMILGQKDIYYLKLKNTGDAAVGDLYTVFKRARKVFHPGTGQYMGYLINRLAVVQVVDVDKELTTVRAVRAYGSVAPGDPVVKFSMPTEGDSGSAPVSGDVMGMVVEVQSDMGMTLVAQWNFVYLDRGAEDGLKAGDRMEVVRTGGGLPPRKVGEVKILSTEARTATALVTKSTSRIMKGDRFRPRVQAGEPAPIPVSQPASQSLNESLTSGEASGKIQVQNAARETRYSLNDLMKQLRYDSGEAKIRPEGYQVLDQLIEQLKAAPPEQLIRVEGHADNMEIGPSLKSIYPTNWDLSKARAGGVLRYLVEKGGIDSARISSVGYGDSRPVVSNATEVGRQKNRRVDIVLYSPEPAKAPSEQAMKPTEAVDDGNRVTGLEADNRGTSTPVSVNEPAADSAKIDNSAAVPASSIPDANPAVGEQSVPAKPMDQPIAPSEK